VVDSNNNTSADARVKALLARGASREARALANELWGFNGMVLNILRLQKELERESLLETPEGAEWGDLGPQGQSVVKWFLLQERGAYFSREAVLDLAKDVSDGGRDRSVIRELIDLGVLAGRNPRGGVHLRRLPHGLPHTIEKHPSWNHLSG